MTSTVPFHPRSLGGSRPGFWAWTPLVALALTVAGVPASAQPFDPAPAWPLCGRITEDPPPGWDAVLDGCPADRHGDPERNDFPLSSSFGPRQKASEGGRYDFHRGLDLPTPTGTPVFALTDGEVVLAGPDPQFSDPLVEVRHARPGAEVDCVGGGGCYHSLYLHLSEWRVTPGQTVAKGELLGYTGASESGFEHLHFEIRDAPSHDPYSAWQRDAIHPLSVLPYPDRGVVQSLRVLSASRPRPDRLRVITGVAIDPAEADLARLEVWVVAARDGVRKRIEQAGETGDEHGYQVLPSSFEFSSWNRQYSHKDSPEMPWESFGPDGSQPCPYAEDHPGEYDPNVHLDHAHPDNPSVGQFNGLLVAPAPFSADSEHWKLRVGFAALEVPETARWICVVARATDVAGGVARSERFCLPPSL